MSTASSTGSQICKARTRSSHPPRSGPSTASRRLSVQTTCVLSNHGEDDNQQNAAVSSLFLSNVYLKGSFWTNSTWITRCSSRIFPLPLPPTPPSVTKLSLRALKAPGTKVLANCCNHTLLWEAPSNTSQVPGHKHTPGIFSLEDF